jgi:AraC-like DNA-binding protein/mannose-6-phosphate isomerase-like protein (cupin superfamily)
MEKWTMEKKKSCRIIGEIMYFELKENKPHGTKDDPFSIYHIANVKRSFQIPVHWHDEFEIIYVKSGFLTVSISGENYIGKPGDAFVVSPGNLHFMGSQTGNVDYFTFLFPLKYISFRTDDILDDKLLEPLNSGHLMISPEIEDTVKEQCEQLVEIYGAKKEESQSKITAQIKTKIILLQFILELWKKGFIVENDTGGKNTVEKEMVSYIQQNFTGKILLKEFGEQFHLSEKYISRYFKEHFHITISQYVTYLRLEHAKQLLQDTDIPVTEVAMQSGYQNVSYFIRSFKKTYGMSPLKYRNK